MNKYLMTCDEDVARIQNQDGKILVEMGRTCPLCGKICDIVFEYGTLIRTCKHCKRERKEYIKR